MAYMTVFQKQFLHPRFWPSWIGLGLMRLSVYLPVSMQLWSGNLMALIISPVMSSRKKIARRNLELCFPEMTDTEREQLLNDNFRTMGMMLIETAIGWWASDESLRLALSETWESITEGGLNKTGNILKKGKKKPQHPVRA